MVSGESHCRGFAEEAEEEDAGEGEQQQPTPAEFGKIRSRFESGLETLEFVGEFEMCGAQFDDSEKEHSFERKYSFELPAWGENSVVLYTTTLRGIRKTFEDCNAVRSTIESHDVRIVERDLSMDSGYREELRMLMGTREVKVPVLFVKGRLIGGAEEVLKLEEDGKMGVMLEGIERAKEWCKGCGGVRFVMCRDCNGSCKVLDEEEKKMVKCGECNENGLIHCPICCSV
uniref:Glutaredoxin domain-containing protein n=1 Tax=Ananas comosus var. bracteatus TaxID=296719 RepID=A0A6V7QWU5_ANACO